MRFILYIITSLLVSMYIAAVNNIYELYYVGLLTVILCTTYIISSVIERIVTHSYDKQESAKVLPFIKKKKKTRRKKK